jgi:TRAP-type C4-dicarboxylate transport system permease small subunit
MNKTTPLKQANTEAASGSAEGQPVGRAADSAGTFDRALVTFSTAIFILVLVLLVVQILSRQLSRTLSWTEELARYLFILTSFLGSAIALRTGEHIHISSFVERLPRRLRLAFNSIADLLMIVFLAITTYGAWRMGNRMLHVPVGFSSAFVSIGHIYLALFGCLLLNLYYLLRHFASTVRDLTARW